MEEPNNEPNNETISSETKQEEPILENTEEQAEKQVNLVDTNTTDNGGEPAEAVPANIEKSTVDEIANLEEQIQEEPISEHTEQQSEKQATLASTDAEQAVPPADNLQTDKSEPKSENADLQIVPEIPESTIIETEAAEEQNVAPQQEPVETEKQIEDNFAEVESKAENLVTDVANLAENSTEDMPNDDLIDKQNTATFDVEDESELPTLNVSDDITVKSAINNDEDDVEKEPVESITAKSAINNDENEVEKEPVESITAKSAINNDENEVENEPVESITAKSAINNDENEVGKEPVESHEVDSSVLQNIGTEELSAVETNSTDLLTQDTPTEDMLSSKRKLTEDDSTGLNDTSKNHKEVVAVIEIDDDNEVNDAAEAATPMEVAEKQVQATSAAKPMSDVIEIDDDDEDEDAGTLKIDETAKANDDAASVLLANEPITDGVVEGATSLQTATELEVKKDEKQPAAKMHAMPMIFYKKECINFECPKSHKEFHRAPQFALNYFKVSKKKSKTQYICADCYDLTLSFYQNFCGLLEAKQPILLQTIANKKQEFVEILDSSDEEEDEISAVVDNQEKENATFSQADLDLIEAELDNTIRKVFDKVDIQSQLTWTKTIFTERVKNLQEELEYIDTELSETQKIADRMYNDLYDCGKYAITTLKPLDLDSENEQIPPLGEIERTPIKIGSVYYAARNKAIGCWIGCKVIEQVDNYLFVPHYRVKFLTAQFQTFKNLSAKLIAYYYPPTVRLSVGQRVIAYFDGTTLQSSEGEKNQVKSAFYPGIIAEEMKPNNFFRYLIFYDDGYTQYVSHKDVRLVCHVARNVWEDVDHVSREFIKKYVQEYRVNRPMVQTHKGQKMTTEKNGRWVPARVVDIDCSLVRMQFEGSKGNHTEWIYRGSLRLNPVYMEYQKSKNNAQQANQRAPLSRVPRRTEPFIRYTDDEESINAQQQQQQQQEQQRQTRTLNRANSTSSTASATAPTVRHLNANTIYLEDEKPKGKVIYFTAKRQMPTRVYRPHKCGSHCLIVIPHNLNGYNPLAKPLLSGWERAFARQKIKKTVYYRAPCGKMFRNMRELHHYLRLTKCSLNVDNFDFYPETSCLAEFEADNVTLKKRDISNGQERIPLPLINYYDDTLPECTYSAKVIPTEGVNINTDPEFLICCDCEDDCVDKSKCACWKLTIEGVKTINPDAQIDEIGYQYKRLYDHTPTGIYECNSRCKCKSHCLNRVVQHSLGLKLQVFKTTNRGWGLRCLNDIPRGSFVCVYAGNLLTEAKANEGGIDAGDEYFAELDYIETVEQLKEGYESDVDTQGDEDEDSYEPEPEDDADFQVSKTTERRVRRGTAGGNEGERQAINFNPKVAMEDDSKKKRLSVRQLFGKEEAVYVMDAKVTGNLGRYFNHSCSPNLFVQNVFVDTHDIRFPCVAFFSSTYIRAGTELTWNYNYEVGVVPGKVLYCQCGAPNCRQRLL